MFFVLGLPGRAIAAPEIRYITIQLAAFDEVAIRMRLRVLVQNRISLAFEYWRRDGAREELVARGEQQVAAMQREGARLVPAPVAGGRSTGNRPPWPEEWGAPASGG